MLDADTTSRTSDELFFSAPGAELRSESVSEGGDDPVTAPLSELMAAARKLVAAARIGSGLSARARAELDQARHLLEALGSAIDRGDVDVDALMVADDGTWFQTQLGRVDVARRGAVKRILLGLAEARLESAGRALSVDQLFEVGWPGEKIPYESQVRRVYTAVWTLRTLGLEGLLLTRDEGYLLDPKRTVRLSR